MTRPPARIRTTLLKLNAHSARKNTLRMIQFAASGVCTWKTRIVPGQHVTQIRQSIHHLVKNTAFIQLLFHHPLEGTYAAASKGHIRKKTQATPPHQAPAGPGPLRQQRTIDLLTPDQVSVLLSNAIPRLMAARNGAEQITTILTICAEYVSQN